MAAIYRVTFTDRSSVYVNSPDAKSMKADAIRTAFDKARKKGAEKAGRKKSDVVAVNCVG